ncbi:MAG: hypothetical protein ACAI35_02200 [Candidatus Methylacidiphilales bacterium]|nr:hypothetical protein [Candidatus Methylacidiphilales bacterium]
MASSDSIDTALQDTAARTRRWTEAAPLFSAATVAIVLIYALSMGPVTSWLCKMRPTHLRFSSDAAYLTNNRYAIGSATIYIYHPNSTIETVYYPLLFTAELIPYGRRVLTYYLSLWGVTLRKIRIESDGLHGDELPDPWTP